MTSDRYCTSCDARRHVPAIVELTIGCSNGHTRKIRVCNAHYLQIAGAVAVGSMTCMRCRARPLAPLPREQTKREEWFDV
jgi:hypothetical protein